MAEATNLNIKINRELKIKTDGGNIKETVTIEQRREAMQEIRDLLAVVDSNSIDLNQIKEERRTLKFARND